MQDRSLEILGFEQKHGEFEGKPWNNIYFHCSREMTGENKAGSEVIVVKVKYDVLSESFGKALTFSELSVFLHKHVEFMYNEKGSVIFVRPVETKSDEKNK